MANGDDLSIVDSQPLPPLKIVDSQPLPVDRDAYAPGISVGERAKRIVSNMIMGRDVRGGDPFEGVNINARPVFIPGAPLGPLAGEAAVQAFKGIPSNVWGELKGINIAKPMDVTERVAKSIWQLAQPAIAAARTPETLPGRPPLWQGAGTTAEVPSTAPPPPGMPQPSLPSGRAPGSLATQKPEIPTRPGARWQMAGTTAEAPQTTPLPAMPASSLPSGRVPGSLATQKPMPPPSAPIAESVKVDTLLDDIAKANAGKSFSRLDPKAQQSVRDIAEKIRGGTPASAPPPPQPTSAQSPQTLEDQLAASVQQAQAAKARQSIPDLGGEPRSSSPSEQGKYPADPAAHRAVRSHVNTDLMAKALYDRNVAPEDLLKPEFDWQKEAKPFFKQGDLSKESRQELYVKLLKLHNRPWLPIGTDLPPIK